MLTNIARNNAARTRELQLSIECTLSPAGIALRFRDDGVAFDPFARAAPRLDADISEREVGGLGIHHVQQVADESGYSFIDGHNVLNILLKYSPTPHGATA